MYRGKAEQAAVVEAKFEHIVKEQENVLEKHLKLSQSYREILFNSLDLNILTSKVQKRMEVELKVLKSFVARRYCDVTNVIQNKFTIRSFRLERAMEQQSAKVHPCTS